MHCIKIVLIIFDSIVFLVQWKDEDVFDAIINST